MVEAQRDILLFQPLDDIIAAWKKFGLTELSHLKMLKILIVRITWVFLVRIGLKPFKSYVKNILNPTVWNFVKTEKDYEEFLELLNKHNVRYCVIGAFALAFHSRPRYTKDIDILVEPTIDNAKRLLITLDEFGFGSLNLAVEDFSTQGNIIQLGYEPVRIDIISSIKGLEFADIWESRVQGPYGKQTVNFIDRQNLIRSKKLSNRPQDKADLKLLLSEK